jgi:hypothetical protein
VHCKKGCFVADLVKHYEKHCKCIFKGIVRALLGHCEGIVRTCIGEGIVSAL